jgi:hypothetical protein
MVFHGVSFIFNQFCYMQLMQEISPTTHAAAGTAAAAEITTSVEIN